MRARVQRRHLLFDAFRHGLSEIAWHVRHAEQQWREGVVRAHWSSPSPAQVEAAAAQFHLALAEALVARATRVASERGVRCVVLGGGCFFNRILAERCVAGLQAQGLRVHTAQALSCGDAGLALGQAWVAAQQLAQAQQSMDSEETAACA